MRRREFLEILAGAAAWPATASAQQSERVRRVGLLFGTTGSDLQAQSLINVTRQRLGELGWSEGHNIRIEERLTARRQQPSPRLRSRTGTVKTGRHRLRRNSAGSRLAAGHPHDSDRVPERQQSRWLRIRCEYCAARRQYHGLCSFEPEMGGKWLETLKEIAPGIARVALVYNPLIQASIFRPLT